MLDYICIYPLELQMGRFRMAAAMSHKSFILCGRFSSEIRDIMWRTKNFLNHTGRPLSIVGVRVSNLKGSFTLDESFVFHFLNK